MQRKAISLLTLCLTLGALSAHKHNRKLADANGFNSAFKMDSNSQTAGTAVANGNGQVAVVANKDGVTNAAQGTQGTQGSTLFVQNYAAAASNNGFNTKGGAPNQAVASNGFGDNYTEVRNTAAATQSATAGNGGFTTGSGINGSFGTAAGTAGSGVAAVWNQQDNATRNSFGFNVNKRLLFDKKLPHKSDSCEDNYGWNNNFADKSATKAAATSQSYGAGYSALSAGRAGTNTEAFGTKGAASKSAFEQQNNSWLVKNAFMNKGGKSTGFNDNSSTNDNTQAFTDARGFGEAGVKSAANRDGINVFSKGSEGTENKGGWNGSNDNWGVKNATGVNHRRRLSEKFKDVKPVVVVDYKKLYEALKAEVDKLKLENVQLKKNCNLKKLGSAQ